MKPLYVVKVGSATLDLGAIHEEVAALVARGARVLLVAGGAVGIERHYRSAGRPMPELRLPGGDAVRYCPPAEMPHIVDAYERVTLPSVVEGLESLGLSVLASVAARGRLVSGRANRPLKAVTPEGRTVVVRDHRAGVPDAVDTVRLEALLDVYDVVCLAPPVAGSDGAGPLNVDADVLAAAVANALSADHLRLVTGTAGLLTDPSDPASTIRHAHPGEAGRYAGGRMRQKVRAAELALDGVADVAITGPHTMADPEGWTRFWRTPEPAPDLRLLSHAVGIRSVSGDERELAEYLSLWCAERGIDAFVDDAGNLVATRGSGPRRLLLLGHLDTVPHGWPVEWRRAEAETGRPGPQRTGTSPAGAEPAGRSAAGQDELWGRGSVDAKGSLVSFLEVLAAADVPESGQLRVVGAVEEEVSSSKGAYHVRDHYPADAVVIGEPSGSGTLTMGYFGLFKLRVTASVPSGHSAGNGAVSAPDALIRVLAEIRTSVLSEVPDALSAVINVTCRPGKDTHEADGVLNFRVPPDADLDALRKIVGDHASGRTTIEVLRATPGAATGRTSSLAKVFARALRGSGSRPRYVVKKGTSDMNTLATTWTGVPMVAYGPGDSALDHTDVEHIVADEYRTARTILGDAVARWFALAEGDPS